MQSDRTEQVIRLTEPEMVSVERRLHADKVEYSIVKIKNEADPTVEALRAIRMPHRSFITECNRIAREREKAVIAARQSAKKAAKKGKR